MTSLPIIGVYNDGHVAEMYEAFRRDPASVDESWRQYFTFAQALGGGQAAPAVAATSGRADPGFLRKVAGAAALLDAIRHYGHLAVPIDPLGSAPAGAAELTAAFHGITEEDLGLVPAEAVGYSGGTAADVAAQLRARWSGRIGYEFSHIEDEGEREWLRHAVDHGTYTQDLTADEQVVLLHRLTAVDGLERFLARAYSTAKRFSIEGTDMMVPMLDAAVDESAALGVQDVVIGMAHRGRLNTLVHLMDKPYAKLFNEFDGKHDDHDVTATGDVKYHLGADTERRYADGRVVRLSLVPNPSHLEVVNPVLTGVARARRDEHGGSDASVLPIVIHGDAAFPGEGVVAESFNMSGLPGYRVGGSLHIISNNQVGFTTNPSDSRSTWYASDLAKGFEVPIVHVNADDVASCIGAVRMAIAYRAKFGKDFLIDLVGYRRWGHNEGDEPTFTQPRLYATIKSHPTVRQRWGQQLVERGILTADAVAAIDAEFQSRMDDVLTQARQSAPADHGHHAVAQVLDGRKLTPSFLPPVDTGIRPDALIQLNERLLFWPESHAVHPRLAKQLERRREALGPVGGIDWGHAETLAFASLVAEGVDVRITGQDAERGTFSHRHAVLNDVNTGAKYTPLQHLPGATGRFEVFNSPLTELAVLAFEYGYSTAAPGALVLWEAQFGDFANMAAPIIDQFIAADRAKWGQDSGVVLLLPHGYEGQGPEHSSARLERFLQLCAEGNLRVAYPSTAAQYFHVLRRQARLPVKRPLVLMQPKSMLRLAAATATLDDLTAGRFNPVLDDPAVTNREDVTRLVFCTGKVYYDLVGKEHPAHLAVVRVEQLYPWPYEEVGQIVDLYPNIAEIVWAQEEPKNMGAWSYVAPRLRVSAGNALIIRYIGRPERASPAEGYKSSHDDEQERIVSDVHAAPLVPRARPPMMR